jgi:hypothetical protein
VRNFALAALVVVCVVPVVGGRAAATAPGDACSLLTKAEIDVAMAAAMGPAKAITTKACQWRRPVKRGDPSTIVDVTIMDARGYNIGKAAGATGKFKITPVNSLGDDAYYSETNVSKLTSLRFKKGESYVAIHVWGDGVPLPELEPKELAIAKAIVPKL